MGVLPLFFEERPGGRSPSDRSDLAIPHDDPLDQDPAELLLPGRRGDSDRLGQCEQAGTVGVEGADPVVVGQRREGRPNRIPLGLVVRVAEVKTNVLYYGDNLDILRRYVQDATVDLVYLDPPFNSNRDYNVIFKDESGQKSDAQIVAFDDTWHWGPGPEAHYAYLTNTGLNHGAVPAPVSTIVAALRAGIGENQMMAYLVEMAVRLVELHRVLKPTGSLYLHCDPTASHYLKVVLDAIFGPQNFRNDIVWKRFNFHADAKRFGRVTDRILFYSETPDFLFNPRSRKSTRRRSSPMLKQTVGASGCQTSIRLAAVGRSTNSTV